MSAAGPRVVVLDVNETVSDLAPLRGRFAEVGAAEELAATWFAAVLREGMALAAVGQQAAFADIGAHVLDVLLPADLTLQRAAAVDHVMAAFSGLSVHPDVPDGLRALREQGLRVVTLSNGAASVAQGLLERAGVADLVEATLSVADAGVWKPAAAAYAHAVAWSGEPVGAHLLVAVHPWDVHGAQQAGWSGAWVDRSGATPYPGYLHAPALRVRDLSDLASRLAG
jgi:2-haloacid dehalogenase